MATTKTNTTKNTTAKKPAAKPQTKKPVATAADSNKTVPETPVVEKAPKTYGQTDPIPCKSIVAGELGMIGIKSKINYNWAERNDITEVEYQDVVAAIRQNSSYIMKPHFIIMDEELVDQFPQVRKLYDTMYTGADLKDILKLPPSEMKTVIMGLPEGAQEALKHIASTQISKGHLDSVKKIKILDELFDTELMLMTGLFNS